MPDLPEAFLRNIAFSQYHTCVFTLKRSVGTDDSSSSSFTFFRISCQSASLFKDLMAWVKRRESSEWSHVHSFPLEHTATKQKVWFVLLQLLNSYLFRICANTFLLKNFCFLYIWMCYKKGLKSSDTVSPTYCQSNSTGNTEIFTNAEENFWRNVWPENKFPAGQCQLVSCLSKQKVQEMFHKSVPLPQLLF